MKRIHLTDGTVPYVKQLLYGLSGSGKTRFAYSAALDDRFWPCIALNAHGNPVSVSDYERHPDIFDIDMPNDLNAVYSFLKGGCQPEHPFAKKSGIELDQPYKCVIIDGITEIQRQQGDKLRGLTDSADIITNITQLGLQNYYALLEQTTRIVRLMYKLDMHVIITALEHDTVIEGSEISNAQPLLLGQSSREVPSYAISTARMMQSGGISKVHKKLLASKGITFTPGSRPVAVYGQLSRQESKDGTGALPMGMLDPTMTKVLNLIEGGDAGN